MSAKPGAATGAGDLVPVEAARSASPVAHALLEAGVAEFARRGYHGTTTRNIAARAGLSPAALYVHFSSKEELLFAITRTAHELAHDVLAEAEASADDPVQRLRAVVSGLASFHAEHVEMARVGQYELPALTDAHRAEIAALRRRSTRLLRAPITDGVCDGAFVVSDVPGAALAVFSLCVDIARWYSPEGARTPESLGALYAELAVRMLQPG